MPNSNPKKRNIYEILAKVHTVIEFILEDLDLLLVHESISSEREKEEIASLFQDLKFISSVIERVQEKSDLQPNFSWFIAFVTESVLDQLLIATDSYVRSKIFETDEISDFEADCFLLLYCPNVADIVRSIKDLQREIINYVSVEDGKISSVKSSFSENPSSIMEEKIVVGFEEEAKELLDRLIAGRKQFEVIPIIGMAGIGKTTLANKLFNDPSIICGFHVRGWTSVSQLYQKRKLLYDILSSIVNENDPVFVMDEEDIGEKLYKCLKGNRYLIVIDDIWDIGAWNDLEMYFPKDDNGSRILVTTRIEHVASEIGLRRAPCFLRFLTQDESWLLFRRKVFADKSIPEELVELGSGIVAKCKGLPLAIVVIAGILAKGDKTRELWIQVAENMGGSINNDSEQLMSTLALSYKHLPSSLKSCFLYLASFPEDHEIQVRKLIRSWISEGFIPKSSEKRLEDVAEDYMKDLVCRSLLIIAKRRSDGGIKSFHIHDLLRDLCIKKATEKQFFQLVCKCGSNNPYRAKPIVPLSSFSYCQFFHAYNAHVVYEYEVSNEVTLSVYNLIRVLDLRHIILENFPKQILQLLHLKYLALWIDRVEKIPPSVFRLWNLQTFILNGDKAGRVALTVDILKMVNLRHLQIAPELVCEDPWNCLSMEQPGKQEATYTVLDNLQTLYQLRPLGFISNFLSRTPNIRKLGFHLTFSNSKEPFSFPDLSSLVKLQTLRFEYHTLGMVSFHVPPPYELPSSLKKLTLIGSHVDWKEMSIIGSLPNLEVLKIKDNFFSGARWETSDDGFRCLRFLKLSHMDIQEWISCSSHFPKLEHLVLNGCLELKDIPSEIGDIPTLQTIEVYRSSISTAESTRQIQESQKCLGNDDLKVFIYHCFEEY